MKKEWSVNVLTDEAAMDWAKKLCWSLGQAYWLLQGFVPEAVHHTDRIPELGMFGKMAEALNDAVDAGTLVSVGPGLNGILVFKPADVVRVAKAANIGAWRHWEGVFDEMESATLVFTDDQGGKLKQYIEFPEADFIEAGLLASQIAEILVPVSDTEPLLVGLEKKRYLLHPQHPLYQTHFKDENLTDEDVDYLKRITPDAPFWSKGNMTQAEYAEFSAIFQNAKDKPEWDLKATFRDFRSEAKTERTQAAIKHMRQMEDAAKAGRLRLLDAHRCEVSKIEPGTLISIDDANRYTEPMGIKLTCGEGANPSTSGDTPKIEAATDTTTPGDDSNKQADIASRAYWRAVLQSHINKIDENGKADVRKIINYMRKLGDERLPNEGKPDTLTWIDDEGTKQSVVKKTVSTAASTARKKPP